MDKTQSNARKWAYSATHEQRLMRINILKAWTSVGNKEGTNNTVLEKAHTFEVSPSYYVD